MPPHDAPIGSVIVDDHDVRAASIGREIESSPPWSTDVAVVHRDHEAWRIGLRRGREMTDRGGIRLLAPLSSGRARLLRAAANWPSTPQTMCGSAAQLSR